jgi:hypothetical protein
MKKADLLNLGKIEVTKDIVDIAKADKPTKHNFYGRTNSVYNYYWFFRVKVFEIGDQQILKIALFRRKEVVRGLKTPAYLIFISKTENKHLTYDCDEKKWKKCKIDYLECGESYYCYTIGRYYSKETEKVIVEYLDNDKKTPYESIFSFQSNVLAENLHRQHRKITDRIDAAMELVPELPKDFYRWIDEIAMIKSRYIYYNYSKNVKEGYCTYCKKMVPVSKPHHNGQGTCKSCKSRITYKAIKKAAKVRDYGYATIFQKTKEGFVMRYFEISRFFDDIYKPSQNIVEAIRIFYNNNFNVVGEYEYAEFKNTGIYRWCFWESRGWNNNRSEYQSTLYDGNLKKVFDGTEFQYSCIDLFTKGLKGDQFYPAEYLKSYRKHKYIEYLVKLKLFQLTKGLIRSDYGHSEVNEYGKRIHDVLKVSKEQVKMLCEMNANLTELRVLQKANEAEVRMNKEQLRWFATNMGRNDLINFMKYSTAHKIIRYLKEQSKCINVNRLSTDYYDYLDACRKLGYEMKNGFILFPKKLIEAHDLAVAEWQQKKDRIDKMKEEERNIEMEKVAEILVKQFSMKDKHFSIRIPWTCEEIKKEGQTLHHCVGGYVDRVLCQETAILFIRKNEEIDVPYYTMEVRNNQIIQIRGKNNCSTTPEVQAFVDKFKLKMINQVEERMAG